MYVTDRAPFAAVAQVAWRGVPRHPARGDAVVVAALIDPAMLVEIEADARRSPRSCP